MVRKQTRRRRTRRVRGGNRLKALATAALIALFPHTTNAWSLGDLRAGIAKLNERPLNPGELQAMAHSIIESRPSLVGVLPDLYTTSEAGIAAALKQWDLPTESVPKVDTPIYVPAHKLANGGEYIYNEPGKEPVNITVDTWSSEGDGIKVSIRSPNYGTIDVKQGDGKTFTEVPKPVEQSDNWDSYPGGKRRKTLRRRK